MKYDLCIIGAGPAGYSGALIAAREGKSVALIEKDRPGGVCLNRGCIPTKALRRAADAWLEAQRAERFGVIHTSPPTFDYSRAAAHRDQAVETLVAGVQSLLKARKVAVVKGEARLIRPGLVRVSGAEPSEIEADHVVIAAGSKPCDLPGIRIDEERVLSSEGALRMKDLPETVIVVGGGVIGCEFADLLASLGVAVTVVEVLPRILVNEDKSTARALQKAMEGRGVKFILGAAIEKIEECDGGVECGLAGGETLSAERVIVSVGRKPSVEGLGLSEAGVEVERGAIKVDEGGRTSAAGVWAAGDVIGPPMLAHAASHEMEVVIANLLGGDRRFDHSLIPWVVYVNPEIASLGLLEDAAKEKGVKVSVGRFAYAANGKAQTLGETEGSAKVIAGEDGMILGATVMGVHAGELIHELAVAMKAGMKVDDFIHVIHAHPTLSELVLETVADARGLAVHKVGRARK